MNIGPKILVLMVFMLSSLSLSSEAHHSRAGSVDVNTTITVTGKITRVAWVNPHAFLELEVVDENSGEILSYIAEFPSVNLLIPRGVTPDRFPVGETISIEGNPALSGKRHIDYLNGTFSDGRSIRVPRAGNQ